VTAGCIALDATVLSGLHVGHPAALVEPDLHHVVDHVPHAALRGIPRQVLRQQVRFEVIRVRELRALVLRDRRRLIVALHEVLLKERASRYRGLRRPSQSEAMTKQSTSNPGVVG
jgi:hypothetical protein